MTEKPIKNLAASVNGRLQNEARATKRPFQELLEGAVLAQALTATCTNRGTAIEVPPLALTADFTEQSATVAQWRAFRKRLAIEQVPETLAEVVAALEPFLLPVARACAAGASFEEHWNPRGPWNAITSR